MSFPFDLYSAAVFESHLPWYDHAILKATSQGHGTARHGMCELTSAVERRHVGDLPAFGFFRLPRGVPRRLLPEAYQSQIQVASVLNCWTSSSDTAGYHADFHEGDGAVGAGQGRGMAWTRHAVSELAFTAQARSSLCQSL